MEMNIAEIEVSEEMMKMARKIISEIRPLKRGDVSKWAAQLAEDVKRADD